MPKFPKGFGRRKSAANELDDVRGAVAEPSFKVFEREGSVSKSFDSRRKFGKSAIVQKASFMADDDNMFENIYNRDSGASNANTFSTTDNSSRLSAASTAPSSTDITRRDEWKTPHDKPFSDIPLPPVPKSSSTFSLKSAGRSLSWGRQNKGAPPPPISKTTPPESPVIEDDHSTSRQRAITASSYASTATPPKLDEKDLGLNLGGDFSHMFGGFGKRKSAGMDAETKKAISRSPETVPLGPATRSLTASRLNQPSPLSIDKNKKIEPSPYSWSSQNSHDGLMSNSTPAFVPRMSPPVPPHSTPRDIENQPQARPQKSGGIANSGLRRSSAFMEPPKRQSTLEYGDAVDEDARLLRESLSASRRMNDTGYEPKIRDSWALPSTASYKVDDSTLSTWPTDSGATPRAKKPVTKDSEDNLFDVNIADSADLAQRFREKSESPPATHTAPQNKVMTPAQFERYKQDQERLGSYGGHSKEDEDEDEEPYDDDEDEAEKNKQLAKQRRKQEAHMSVYRQQMMKVTGEAIPPIRPNVHATQSSPNLAVPGAEEAEEDEEVPLAILQAHGFPNKGKQQMRSMGSNPNLRSPAQMNAGGVVGADSRLPVFARHLPQDPYLGAGLVNPMHRESLAFGGGAGSVSAAAPRGQPGGLVGVIVNEERSRAMRRGNPNPQGDYGSALGGGFSPTMGMQPPAFGGNNGMGPMNPMMLTPGDQAQIQMSQQMQQFMQMQMQFMQIMTAGGQAPPGQMQPAGELPRPSSAQHLRPASSHPQVGPQQQRAMTMLDPNAAAWMQNGSQYAHSQGGGYAPSIAPSERSNVGLPGRYRPVSQAPPQAQHNHTRASTMSGALNGWGDKSGASIKTAKKFGNVSDEDDEEGWEEMMKKRQQKKSLWRTKKDKDTNGLKDLMGCAQ
ncbi:hypothetical protein B2J93_5519 [Marssonina coronariae]|uniref:Uncharacterized protein n=1 Tax=Diplocarpon coronariae TaxID=2795749 RepID=A0A218YZP1_9HELO|nr:hypothetical protein B2J93_5519 [Marssonina coronariae]